MDRTENNNKKKRLGWGCNQTLHGFSNNNAVQTNPPRMQEFPCQKLRMSNLRVKGSIPCFTPPPPPYDRGNRTAIYMLLEPVASFVSVQMGFHLFWIIAQAGRPAGVERGRSALPSGASGSCSRGAWFESHLGNIIILRTVPVSVSLARITSGLDFFPHPLRSAI
jgi:hypothetical protein